MSQDSGLYSEPYTLSVGCNYWASHAGVHMWSNWRPDIVQADMEQLAAAGLNVLRVFPLWPEFQPLTLLRGGGGIPVEYRLGEEPLPASEAGQAGVSETMLARFEQLADFALQRDLLLIPSLITGWMSGRLFTPPAFAGTNPIVDPECIKWQVRFAGIFVRRFKDHPAITAWDLGNECNVMGPCSRPEAWLWTHAIASAIRKDDSSRRIISGMHSLSASQSGHWTIRDQSELTDLLTTHPYPLWTPHCDSDPLDSLRPSLHAIAECRLYSDIGGSPCMAQELGTMGPFICSDDIASRYLRMQLYLLWSHDCRGLLWWCAYDQSKVKGAPYDWILAERELGLFQADRTPKPLVAEFTAFAETVRTHQLEKLPPRRIDAVCILTEDQDQWAVGYNSFILAKQAGVNLEFQMGDQPLRSAPIYLLPCLSGLKSMQAPAWDALLCRVAEGATLYISLNDAILSGIPFTGCKILSREKTGGTLEYAIRHSSGPCLISQTHFRLRLEIASAELLGSEPDGNPIFTRAIHGKGQIFFLTVPLELDLARQPMAYQISFSDAWKIYQRVFAGVSSSAFLSSSPLVTKTEHAVTDEEAILVLVNHSSSQTDIPCKLSPGWVVDEVVRGSSDAAILSIPPNDALILRLKYDPAPSRNSLPLPQLVNAGL